MSDVTYDALKKRIAELEAALEKQEAITKEDAKWSMVYHQWCVMNGCPPSSSNLIAALDVLEEKKVMTKQTTPFQLTVEENNANHSLNVIVLQKRIKELEAALSSIARNTCCDRCQEAALVASAALAGEKL